MSKSKDRERAELGKPFRNTIDKVKENWKCFLCNTSISRDTGAKLTAYAKSKPVKIQLEESKKLNALLKGRALNSRICSKCYKKEIEA